MRTAHDNEDIRRHASEICWVPTQGYSSTEFDMPDLKMKALIEAGHLTATEHLRQRGLA
jgi:hypothetical protein